MKKAGEEEDWKKKTRDRGGWKRLSDEAVKTGFTSPLTKGKEEERDGRINPIDRDRHHWCFTMVFQNMAISVFGSQSEMKHVRFLSCLLNFCIFCQPYKSCSN